MRITSGVESLGFPGGSMVKNLPARQETQEMQVLLLDQKVPWRRNWQPTPVFLPGKSHGQRSLVGYSLWGSYMTELPSTELYCEISEKREGRRTRAHLNSQVFKKRRESEVGISDGFYRWEDEGIPIWWFLFLKNRNLTLKDFYINQIHRLRTNCPPLIYTHKINMVEVIKKKIEGEMTGLLREEPNIYNSSNNRSDYRQLQIDFYQGHLVSPSTRIKSCAAAAADLR